MRYSSNYIIGVLSLQGSFHEHVSHFENLISSPKYENFNISIRYVKEPQDLKDLSALVLPGGESTTMSILAQRNNLLQPLRELVQSQSIAIWGTCAGLILISDRVINSGSLTKDKNKNYQTIGGLDVITERNSFGRQINSFTTNLNLNDFYQSKSNDDPIEPFEAVFIRAPVIKGISGSMYSKTQSDDSCIAYAPKVFNDDTIPKIPVQVLAKVNPSSDNNKDQELIVAVKQGKLLGTSFHPELNQNDYRFHEWFLDEFVLADKK